MGRSEKEESEGRRAGRLTLFLLCLRSPDDNQSRSIAIFVSNVAYSHANAHAKLALDSSLGSESEAALLGLSQHRTRDRDLFGVVYRYDSCEKSIYLFRIGLRVGRLLLRGLRGGRMDYFDVRSEEAQNNPEMRDQPH